MIFLSVEMRFYEPRSARISQLNLPRLAIFIPDQFQSSSSLAICSLSHQQTSYSTGTRF